MNNPSNQLVRLFGFFVLTIAAAGFAFIGYAIFTQGLEFFRTPGSLVLVFSFCLMLLLASSGLSLSIRGPASLRHSLIPGWALVISGVAMLVASIGVLFIGNTFPYGIVGLGFLGAYWIWSGLRRAG